LQKFRWFGLACVLLLSGCVYFNTYYNAEKYFLSAQSRPLNTAGRATPQAVDDYTKAIKKCGAILTEHKTSRWADDALWLLAQALFYKGNSTIQAVEKCDDLLKFFPNSPYIPQSILLKAKGLRELNRSNEANTSLELFIQNKAFKKYHAAALLQLAEYKLEDKEYEPASYYLAKLTKDYPKSKEYDSAYLLLGQSLYDRGKYNESIDVLNKMLHSSLQKIVRKDASYLLALNKFEVKDYSGSMQIVKKLSKDESQAERISRLDLLRGRILLAQNKEKEGLDLLNQIMVDSPRSLLSAEATYRMGEYYLSYSKEYDKAITAFNKVRQESTFSPFTEIAALKSNIATQIITVRRPSSTLSAIQVANEQFKLAEFYREVLAQPDSAMIVYQRVIDNEPILVAQYDSLITAANTLLYINSKRPVAADTLKAIEADSVKNVSTDTTKVQITKAKTTSISDSLMLAIPKQIVSYDSLTWDKQTLVDSLKGKWTEIGTHLKLKTRDLAVYRSEIIPYSYYVRIWLAYTIKQDTLAAQNEYHQLQEKYPGHKYAYAAGLLLTGQQPRFISQEESDTEAAYDAAIRLYDTNPDSAIVLLQGISMTRIPQYRQKALFSLGFHYWFDKRDSVAAKPYLDTLLTMNRDSEYANFVKGFYTGSKFLITTSIDSVKIALPASVKPKEEPKTEISPKDDTKDLPPQGEKPESPLKEEKPPIMPPKESDILKP